MWAVRITLIFYSFENSYLKSLNENFDKYFALKNNVFHREIIDLKVFKFKIWKMLRKFFTVTNQNNNCKSVVYKLCWDNRNNKQFSISINLLSGFLFHFFFQSDVTYGLYAFHKTVSAYTIHQPTEKYKRNGFCFTLIIYPVILSSLYFVILLSP